MELVGKKTLNEHVIQSKKQRKQAREEVCIGIECQSGVIRVLRWKSSCVLVHVSSDSLTMKQIKHGQLVYRVFLWQKGKSGQYES